MRLVWMALACLLCGHAGAQILIGSGGDAYTTTTNHVVLTVGEMVIETQQTTSNVLTYGFNQPIPGTIGVLEQGPISIEIFPNPTSNLVRIQTPFDEPLAVEIWNSQGQFLSQTTLTPNHPTIDFTNLPAALYIVRLEWQSVPTELKIIKR